MINRILINFLFATPTQINATPTSKTVENTVTAVTSGIAL